ncbi:pentatricopeptide repeat-containing protein At1g04840-like [Coffea eugenioides]|uniref:pentatricopeptide repeat-containing protein At1g04840-like n=1 Tax=Coffea eugenioides TaxID=49369 RepID=UPI000F6137E7|nr:pentatricopeptide repeat-containing protein At1g04840-like [Coffea eugenioides]
MRVLAPKSALPSKKNNPIFSPPPKPHQSYSKIIPQNPNQAETHFITLIHASKTILQLQQIHSQLILQAMSSNSKIITQLISSSSSQRSIDYALHIFNSFTDPNVYMFNALIRGLTENSWFRKTFEFFKLMLRLDVRPSRLTFPFVLKSVVGLGDKWLGGMVHGGILKMGLEFDGFVRVSLVDMYAKMELLSLALQLFDESPERNKLDSVLLWNVVINGCCKSGILEKAVELFEAMPERNFGSWNSLINGLMRNGKVDKAVELFEGMVEKNVVSWTTMVHGLSLNGMHEKALEMFFNMIEEEGARANDLTLVSVLSACAKTGALEAGMKIHKYILSNKFRFNAAVGTALIDMYAKCGQIQSASQVFRDTKEKDVRTWSVMIWGWAIHGSVEQALQCFEKMKLTGIEPDEVAFLAVLTACSHAGLVDEGLKFFDSMKLDYSIEPTMKHCAVIVDLYGRAGQLDKALRFIQCMALTPDFVIWGALFSACRAHKNIEMAKYVSEKLLQLEPKHSGSYVFMSNIYAGVGIWEEVERVRTSMKDKGAAKDPGLSHVEVHGKLHSFVAGDQAHMHTKEIYSKLEEMTNRAREHGYIPETEWVLHNIEEEEKEDALGTHSEKLALAFGLIRTSPGVVLRIVKNLRICGDCHSLMKHVSKLSQREIVVRDIKRFHHFKDGICSCQDYW